MKKNTIKLIALNFLFIVFIATLFSLNSVFSQGKLSGEVTKVQGGQKVPADFVRITIMDNGTAINGTETDDEGKFSIAALNPGVYQVRIFDPATSYTKTLEGVSIGEGKTTRIKPIMDVIIGGDEGVVVYGEAIHVDGTIVDTEFDPKKIQQSGKRNVNDIAEMSPGVYVGREGATPIMRGARPGGTAYYIDGVKVIGPPSLPQGAIGHMSVIHGGIPAEYGDATGGFIVVTTKNPRMVQFKSKKAEPKAKPKNENLNDDSFLFERESDNAYAMLRP